MHLQMISTFSFLNHIIGILRASNINVFSILHPFSKEFAVKKLCVRFFFILEQLRKIITLKITITHLYHSSTFQYFSHIVR